MLPYFMSLQVKFQIYIDLSIFSLIRKVLFTSTTDPKYYYRPSAGRALRTIYFFRVHARALVVSCFIYIISIVKQLITHYVLIHIMAQLTVVTAAEPDIAVQAFGSKRSWINMLIDSIGRGDKQRTLPKNFYTSTREVSLRQGART